MERKLYLKYDSLTKQFKVKSDDKVRTLFRHRPPTTKMQEAQDNHDEWVEFNEI